MSLFDELAQLRVKFKPDQSEPHQWIYAVDDAWFHPRSSTVQINENGKLTPCKPVFEFHWAGELTNMVGAWLLEPPSSDREEQQDSPLAHEGSASAGEEDRGDSAVARRILKFTKEQFDKHRLDYGVCFCSFEYFWRNADKIDQPQNAVLFDIRHALGWEGSEVKRAGSVLDLTALRKEWHEELERTGLFKDVPTPAHMGRLGWYLHYCLKFAKISGQAGARCSVHNNHIQIVSSAVNPDAGRPDALSDYTLVQAAIWEGLSPLIPGSVDDITPDRFSFSPMPKLSAMDTGLAIFNNSFRRAGKWESVQEVLFHDAGRVWKSTANCGHPQSIDGLKCAEWWSGDSECLPLVKSLFMYYHKFSSAICVKYKVLRKILERSMVQRHFADFSVTGVDDNTLIQIPSNPPILWMTTLVDFLDKLEPEVRDDHCRPSPKLRIFKDGNKLTIATTLDIRGVQEIESLYPDKKDRNSGAMAALAAIGEKCGCALLDYSLAKGRLIEQRGKDCSCDFATGAGANVAFPPNTPDELTICILLDT